MIKKRKEWRIPDNIRREITALFPDTGNRDIAEKYGVSVKTVRRIAKEASVSKTEEHMTEMRRKACEKSNLLRYLGLRKCGGCKTNHFFKKGVSNLERYGAEKNAERIRRMAEAKRESVKAERRRILYGLPQKTKLKLVGSPKRNRQRCALRKRGYIIARDSRIAYWTNETKRSWRVENKGEFLTFKPMIQEAQQDRNSV